MNSVMEKIAFIQGYEMGKAAMLKVAQEQAPDVDKASDGKKSNLKHEIAGMLISGTGARIAGSAAGAGIGAGLGAIAGRGTPEGARWHASIGARNGLMAGWGLSRRVVNGAAIAGLVAALATRKRSRAEQEAYDAGSGSKNYIPGVNLYNLAKRIGAEN